MQRWTILFAAAAALPSQDPGDASAHQERARFERALAGMHFRSIGPAMCSGRIADVAVDPVDDSRWFVAAASGGVWRTVNNGTTFEPVFEREGSFSIGCVAIDPSNRHTVWVGSGENNSQRSVSWGDGVYRSRDGGRTWQNVGLRESQHIGRIAIDPRDSDTVWVAAQGPLWNAGGERGVYKTTDGGASWQRVLEIDEHTGANEVHLDPRDPDVAYASTYQRRRRVWTLIDGGPGSGIHKTTDGGRTWHRVGNEHRHVDDHALWVDPRNTDHLLIGGDGGLYETWDGGANWDFKENLSLAQFYRVSTDMAAPFYNVYGGTQDNNSMGGPSRTTSLAGITNDDWFVTVGGDGYEAQVDPTNPDLVYTQWQYGGLVRHDRRSGELTDIKPRQRPDERPIVWNWDTPLLLSAHSPTRLYFAADRLFRSDDRGDSWRTISGDLTRGIDRDQLEIMGRVQDVDAVAKNASTSVYGNAVSLSESPFDENVLYVGTDDGLVHVTRDAGASWARIERFPGVPERTYVSRLEASRHSPGRVYAGFNNHKNGDFAPYLLVSDDFGASWRSLGETLPDGHVVWSLAEDGEREDLLFCGTEYGLFVSLDRGGDWHRMKGGLPTIAVRDIELQRREHDLVLGTFGRGIYVLDDYAPLRELLDDTLSAPAHLFAVRTAPLYIQRSRLGLNTGLGSQGATYFAAANPPFGAILTLHLRDGFETLAERRVAAQGRARDGGEAVPFPSDDDMRAEQRENAPAVWVTIRDDQGGVVRRVDAPRTRGLHRVAWDLRYPKATRIELEPAGPGAPWSMPDAGPLVLAGTFTATLECERDGEVEVLGGPVAFDVEALGLATLPATDRAEVLAFQRQVVELRRAVRASVRVLDELQDRVDHCRVAVRRSAAEPALLADVERLDRRLGDLGAALTGDESLSSRNKPASMSIRERVENIAGAQLYTSSAPTATERDAYGFAADAFGPVLSALRAIATEQLPAIERALELAGAGDTPARMPEWRRR